MTVKGEGDRDGRGGGGGRTERERGGETWERTIGSERKVGMVVLRRYIVLDTKYFFFSS